MCKGNLELNDISETPDLFGISTEEIEQTRRRLVNMKILGSAEYPAIDQYEGEELEEIKRRAGTAPYKLSQKDKMRFAEIQMKRLITYVRTSDTDKYDHPQVKLCDIDRSDLRIVFFSSAISPSLTNS